MSDNQSDATCRNLSWLAAILLGILVFLIAWKSLEMSVLVAFIIGLIVAGVIGWVLTNFFCSSTSATVEATSVSTPVAAPSPTPKTAPAPAPKPAAAPAPKPEAKAEPKAEPAKSSGGGAPAKLDGPRDGKGDDLKLIKGVGPGLEKALNGMGVYHFDQMAAWTAAEVEWVDDNLLRFKGRATRDGWVEQAKILAAGGTTEFSSRSK